MKLSRLLNFIGGVLVVAGFVLHIICLSTPHMAGVSSEKIRRSILKLMESNVTLDVEHPAEETGLLWNSDIHYGLWEFCVRDTSGNQFQINFCSGWSTTTDGDNPTENFKMIDWIHGAQAVSILGLLVALMCGMLAGLHLFFPSRGDRLRFLPLFICIGSFAAGVIILCGDIVVAAKYDTIFTSMADHGIETPSPTVSRALESAFHLSWGFALDVVSVALLFLAGLFFLLAGRVSLEGGGIV